MDYEETMKTWTFDTPLEAGNVKIDEIQISPVSAVVDFYTLSDERADFAHAVLNLKSGIQIEAEEMRWDEGTEDDGKCRILWKSVVDMEEIESVEINGTVISL